MEMLRRKDVIKPHPMHEMRAIAIDYHVAWLLVSQSVSNLCSTPAKN